MEARSSDNASSTITAIDGENRGYGTELQSSGERRQYGFCNVLVMGMLLHGIAIMFL